MPNPEGIAEDSTDANIEARLLSSVDFHILLVDDSEADAAIFAAALQEASTRVRNYWVGSGEEAIQFVQRRGRFEEVRPAKVVVLDLNLPKQNGFDVLREIRADARSKHLPVIIFSTSANTNDVNMAYALGANAYFVKPMSLEMYVSKVRIIVEHWLDFAMLPTPNGC